MVNPLAILPTKPSAEGFAPLPSYPANEFMAMQGATMALFFGAYYSIGKRAIAKLDNEDFNLMLSKPELFSDHLNALAQPIIDNFQYRVGKYTEENQKLILTKAYELEKAKLHINYDLMTYFIQYIGGKGLDGIAIVASLLGFSYEETKKIFGLSETPTTTEPSEPVSGSDYDPSQPTDFDNVPDATSPTPEPTPTPTPTPEPEPEKSYTFSYLFCNANDWSITYNKPKTDATGNTKARTITVTLTEREAITYGNSLLYYIAQAKEKYAEYGTVALKQTYQAYTWNLYNFNKGWQGVTGYWLEFQGV